MTTGPQPQPWPPVRVTPVDTALLSGDIDLARAVAAALQTGMELTVEQRTVIQVGAASSPYVDEIPIRTVYPVAQIAAQQQAPAPVSRPTEVTVTPVDDPLWTRDSSFWVTAAIIAGGVTVVGLAVFVVALFVMWVAAGLAAVSAWVLAIAPYLLCAGLVVALVMVIGAIKRGKCSGVHCPGPH